jgi:hypothetical protein
MTRLFLMLAAVATSAAIAVAAPPENGGAAKPSAADKVREAKERAAAAKEKANGAKDKATGAGALAERRAAAARQKMADAAKRLIPKFDANRDNVLDDAEWTKAKAAIDKLIDTEVLKTAGARRELVRDALANLARPDVQRNGTDITTEAVEQYARDSLTAAMEAAEHAQPAAAPTPPPEAGRRAGSNNGDNPRNGRFERRLPRPDATNEQRAREEALRRRGLREEGGRIVPIVPGRQGANPGNGQRPNGQGGTRP